MFKQTASYHFIQRNTNEYIRGVNVRLSSNTNHLNVVLGDIEDKSGIYSLSVEQYKENLRSWGNWMILKGIYQELLVLYFY